MTSQRANLKGSKRCRFNDKLRFKVRKHFWQAWICILQNHYYLVVEEFGDVREELEAEVQLYGFRQDTRRHAAASVPAHLTGLGPQSHLDQDRRARTRAHTKQAA